MTQIPRQRIALVLFMACCLMLLGGFVLYLTYGHSWNVAATKIDDATGELDGYTAILFEGTDIPTFSNLDSPGVRPAMAISLAKVENDYLSKNAVVVKLDATTPALYESPRIIQKGEWRFAVISISESFTPDVIQARINDLKRHQVDFVVGVVPYESAAKKISGIDILIDLDHPDPNALSTDSSSDTLDAPTVEEAPLATDDTSSSASDVSASTSSSSSSSTAGTGYYIVHSPPTGTVGAIVISPAKVISARTVTA